MAIAPGGSDPLARRARETPDRPALIVPALDESVTFGDLDRRVDATAAALDVRTATGRIGLCVADREVFVRLVGAIWRIGGSVVVLDPDAPARALRERASAADIAALVSGSTVDIGPGGDPFGAALDAPVVGVDSLRGDPDEAPPSADWPADREAVVVFTSGTTGTPQGVRLDVRTLAASVRGWADRLGPAADRWFDPLPVHHMGGFMPIVRALGLGTPVAIERSPDPTRLAEILADRPLSGVSLVPTQLSDLLATGWEPPETLDAVLVGGAPITVELRERALDRGVPLWPTYGTTETASGIAIARPADLDDHPETVGRPLAGLDVTICDPETGDRRAPGATGEIVVDGAGVTPGYLDDAGEWTAMGLRTGDIGHLADGHLVVDGRLDDRIITGGETVDPGEVEAVLAEYSAVDRVAVVGRPDDRWGERVVAAVRPAVERLTIPDLDAYASQNLAPPKRPREWALVESLPRTASGTVDRRAVRDWF